MRVAEGMPGARWIAVLLFAATFPACSRIPPETVDLSAAMGRDLAEVRRAHVALVRSHFGRLRGDVHQFVDGVYRPFVIRKTMEDLDILAEIGAAQAPGSDLDPVDIMEIFAEEVIANIEGYKRQLLQPIDDQELTLVGRLEAAYQNLQDANAALTAHLASVRKVEDARSELLARVGLENAEEQTSVAIARLSQQLAEVLEKGRRGEATLDAIPADVRKALEGIQ